MLENVVLTSAKDWLEGRKTRNHNQYSKNIINYCLLFVFVPSTSQVAHSFRLRNQTTVDKKEITEKKLDFFFSTKYGIFSRESLLWPTNGTVSCVCHLWRQVTVAWT
jgi:hypothetical protein